MSEYLNVQFVATEGVTAGIMVDDEGVMQLWMQDTGQQPVVIVSCDLTEDDRLGLIHLLTTAQEIAASAGVLNEADE